MNALDVASQTLRVLLPEIILVVGAAAMLTASAFVRAPRSRWCLRAVLLHLLAFAAVMAMGMQTTDPYSAPVVNDDLAYHARLGFLVTGLLLLALAHNQVEEARAGEFFGGRAFGVVGPSPVGQRDGDDAHQARRADLQTANRTPPPNSPKAK